MIRDRRRLYWVEVVQIRSPAGRREDEVVAGVPGPVGHVQNIADRKSALRPRGRSERNGRHGQCAGVDGIAPGRCERILRHEQRRGANDHRAESAAKTATDRQFQKTIGSSSDDAVHY
jgi:hypothetical protein